MKTEHVNGNEIPLLKTPEALFIEMVNKFAATQVKQIQLAGGQLDMGAFMINTQINVQIQECLIDQLAEVHGLNKDDLLNRVSANLAGLVKQFDGPQLLIPSSSRQ